MKKILALLLTLSFTIMISACGWAETVDLFAQIKDRVFTFSSGVGGWSTELNVGENGAFTGNFHDSEMGETGEGYPNGSMYGCLFHG